MNKILLLVLAAFMIGLYSCKNNEPKNESEKIQDQTALAYLETDIDLGEMPEYTQTGAGQSERIDRAFENAPPMIPHSTVGFFPITISNNICLTCHMPDKAEEAKSIPLPKTHFTDLRPEVIQANGLYKVDAEDNVVVKEELDDLNNAYFHCSQCHVPQVENKFLLTENNFTPEFRTEMGKRGSNLKDLLNEGIQ